MKRKVYTYNPIHSTLSPIGEAMKRVIEFKKWDRKIDEASLIQSWPEIVGPTVSENTEKIWFAKNKLYVVIKSAALRNELFMFRTNLRDRLNKLQGKDLIEELVIM